MRFEWDERKNKANRKEHGVSFETASEVFDDPFYLSRPDLDEGDEDRSSNLGAGGGTDPPARRTYVAPERWTGNSTDHLGAKSHSARAKTI